MNSKFKIITNGEKFKVQERILPFLPLWKTVQRPENLNSKDFGGDKSFNSKEEAQNYIDEKNKKQWKDA